MEAKTDLGTPSLIRLECYGCGASVAITRYDITAECRYCHNIYGVPSQLRNEPQHAIREVSYLGSYDTYITYANTIEYPSTAVPYGTRGVSLVVYNR